MKELAAHLLNRFADLKLTASKEKRANPESDAFHSGVLCTLEILEGEIRNYVADDRGLTKMRNELLRKAGK